MPTMDTKDFLNPKSMLTPGFAGATCMTIANALSGQFHLIEPWPAIIALALAFLFGVLAITEPAPWWQHAIYFMLNSLVIFTVAVGSNTLGRAATGQAATGRSAEGAAFAPPAYAQPAPTPPSREPVAAPPPPTWCCLNGKVNPASREECERWDGRLFPTEEAAQRACQATPSQKSGGKSFFRPWFHPQQ